MAPVGGGAAGAAAQGVVAEPQRCPGGVGDGGEVTVGVAVAQHLLVAPVGCGVAQVQGDDAAVGRGDAQAGAAAVGEGAGGGAVRRVLDGDPVAVAVVELLQTAVLGEVQGAAGLRVGDRVAVGGAVQRACLTGGTARSTVWRAAAAGSMTRSWTPRCQQEHDLQVRTGADGRRPSRAARVRARDPAALNDGRLGAAAVSRSEPSS
jgi:hypothetical protein